MTSPTAEAPSDTRARLLDVAGELFAEKGFEAATVREICRRAHVNVAAVNYHFGDKQGLYTAVVRSVVRFAEQAAQSSRSGSAEEQFREFVSRYMHGLLGAGRPTWAIRVMHREMSDPTPALGHVVAAVVKPTEKRLREIVGAMLGRSPDQEAVRLCVHSVIGQCLHYKHASPVLAHLWPDLWKPPDRIDRLVDHIVSFSACALREMAKQNTRA